MRPGWPARKRLLLRCKDTKVRSDGEAEWQLRDPVELRKPDSTCSSVLDSEEVELRKPHRI